MSGTSLSSAFQIIPTTEAPNQEITAILANQACLIRLYTKSINVPIDTPLATTPPAYQNRNPCFIDLYVSGNLIIGGVYCRQGSLVVRDTYFGFQGDLSVIDSFGQGADPYGVPPRLPPAYLQTEWQRNIPLSKGPSTRGMVEATDLDDMGMAPLNYGGRMPGMGTRWLLTYWPVGSYTPGYSLKALTS